MCLILAVWCNFVKKKTMRYFLWNKNLFLFLLPIILSAQVNKTDLTRLPYDELKELFIKNDKNQKKQFEYVTEFFLSVYFCLSYQLFDLYF